MIQANTDLQCLECDICGEAVELSRKAMSDPETVFLMKEHMTTDHATCAPYEGDRAAAVRNRAFHVRVHAALGELGAAEPSKLAPAAPVSCRTHEDAPRVAARRRSAVRGQREPRGGTPAGVGGSRSAAATRT